MKMMEHGVHGKLTGAGGEGGLVLGFYIPKDADLEGLIPELEKLNYTVYKDITLSKTGLQFI